jgi:Zn-finger nucleic acid-binding protein
MAFLCPHCTTATIEPAMLEEGLPADRCQTCGGHWITAARYFAYLAGENGVLHVPATAGETAADSQGVRLCPTCGKFMRYYPVGHGIAFGINKCNTCGGIWLDGGEWEALRAHDLHRQLHAISSDVWQIEVHRQIRHDQEEASMLRRLGHADYQELRRVCAWLRGHAHRDELLAYLQKEGHPPAR